jgi:hypothetical protein
MRAANCFASFAQASLFSIFFVKILRMEIDIGEEHKRA